jgi:U3 small nucleolar RNA-associated protein 11
MLKNIKKYIPRRKYRERSQNERRKKLGFLEKKQDYKIRAEDYHAKEKKYQNLKEAARTRNPDEFYHKMIKAKIIDGEHVQFPEDKTLEQKIVTNTQFINLVNFKKSQLEKEAEKLKYRLQMNKNIFDGGNKSTHTLYYEDEDEYFEEQKKEKELLSKKRNRNKTKKKDKNNEEEKNDEELANNINNENKVLTPENKQLINTYKQRKKHVKQLQQISQGLQEQKELLIPSKKKKTKDGFFKYFIERKK